MKEDAEQLEGELSTSRSLIPQIQMEQDDMRGRMAAMDPNSPEYVSSAEERSCEVDSRMVLFLVRL